MFLHQNKIWNLETLHKLKYLILIYKSCLNHQSIHIMTYLIMVK